MSVLAEEDMDSRVPIINFSAYNLDEDVNQPNDGMQQLIDGVHKALTTVGFFHLKNFGIPSEAIERAFWESRNFFNLGDQVKEKYTSRVWIERAFPGWIPLGRERLNPRDDEIDLKESFGFKPYIKETPDNQLPDVTEVPGLRPVLLDLFNHCTLLHSRVLKVMARGLQLEDPMTLVNLCQQIGKQGNSTALRTLYYPPIRSGADTDKLIRCSEHTDYGIITLLFQYNTGGLQVRDISSRWIPITPIPGTVLVIIGELMQRLTADVCTAAKHRVVSPTDDIRATRQSMAFFGNPDDNATIKCLDGSDKYRPVNAREHIRRRARESRRKCTQASPL